MLEFSRRPTLATGYLIWVYTGSTEAAGTNAKITLVLRGELGIVKKTVDTSLQGTMESGKTDFVVIQSLDAGKLIEIAKYNSMGVSFFGNSARRCEKIWLLVWGMVLRDSCVWSQY